MHRHTHIAVVGNIGSGKTLVVGICGELFPKLVEGVVVIPINERFRHNPFLGAFYADRVRWALQSQVFFLLEKRRESLAIAYITGTLPASWEEKLFSLAWLLESVDAAEQILVSGFPIVVFQDASLQQYWRMYASALAEEMGEASFRLYESLFSILVPEAVKPDMLICLEASVPVLMGRIRTRAERENRPFEAQMEPAYLERLEQHLQIWLSGLNWPYLLRINTDPLVLTGDNLRERDQEFVVLEVISTWQRL